MLKCVTKTSHLAKFFSHPSQCQERTPPDGYFVDHPGCCSVDWYCNMPSPDEHLDSHSWNGQLTGPVSASVVVMWVNLFNCSCPRHAAVLDRYSRMSSGVQNG